jgi:hypothetical protein
LQDRQGEDKRGDVSQLAGHAPAASTEFPARAISPNRRECQPKKS